MTRETSQRLGSFIALCGFCAVLSLLGAWIAQAAAIFKVASDATIPQNSNFYQYTFVRFDPFALYAGAAFFLGLYLVFSGEKTPSAKMSGLLKWERLPLMVALGVLVATCVGRFAVYQNFDLCIDESLNDFEVRILDQHHLVATVPVEWRADQGAMKVPYEIYNPDKGYWASGFLPGFASLDYLFSKVGLSWALSPTLAALSLLVLASVARRTFPDQPVLAANLAILLLALSPQFLAMAMTKFAWTAHLFGTLLWVWLFIHPNRLLFLLTPILGALLIGLHQPHVHPLMAAPFVLRLIYTRQWKTFSWFVLWYLIGAWGWYQVYVLLRPPVFASGNDLNNLLPVSTFSLIPVLLSLIFATFHSVTLLAWATPMLFPFLGLLLFTWKKQPVVVRDGFLAVCLTFLFYLFFPHPQGHGWGFRYLHSVYGLLALASAGGALTLCRVGWNSLVSKAILASVAFSLLVQIPYRVYEIRAMVRPLALTWNYISSRPSDFVIIKTSDFWYSWDLIRNDPWLRQKPLVFDGNKLTPAQWADLNRKGTVTVIGADDVKGFGVILSDPKKSPAP
ncbi:MAG: hypothetical protein LV480_15115 [Methylacidiphilales bacterium]|nr:hypothetical protein [Candidatus Methylacidiphilales bacterium]